MGVHPQANGGLGNEEYTIVGMISVSRYSLHIQRKVEEVHKRTAWCCEPCEHTAK